MVCKSISVDDDIVGICTKLNNSFYITSTQNSLERIFGYMYIKNKYFRLMIHVKFLINVRYTGTMIFQMFKI